MQGNLNPSARAGVVGIIPPAQQAAGTVSTGWVDLRTFWTLMALLSVGAFGASGTVDMRVEQATDSSGAGAKPVPGLAITQLVAAGGNNRQVVVNVRPEDVDKNGGFKFVRLTVTVGTAATFLSAVLLGLDPRYGAAGVNQSNTVAETVS